MVRDVGFSSVSFSDCEIVEPQTFFQSPESVAPALRLESEAKMSIEGPSVKNCAKSGQKQAHAHAAKLARVSPPTEGTLLRQTARCPGTPTDSEVEVDEMEVEDAKPDLEFDANHPWTPKERVIIRGLEDYFNKEK